MQVDESRAGPGLGPPLGTIEMDAKKPVRIRLARRFGVPPQRVFDAWTKSKAAGQWLFAAGASICVEIDARAGGWFYVAGRRNGELAEYVGEYLEVVWPRRLVFALLAELNLLHEHAVHLTTGPLYHSGPLAFASLSHTLGAPIVVLRKFDPVAWLRLVRDHRVTNTFSAPTQLKRIVSLPAADLAGADMSSMICLIANAAPVPYALKEEVFDKLGTTFLFEVYGSTELGVDTVLKPEDQLRKPGSCGKPYGGVQIRIVRDDEREIFFASDRDHPTMPGLAGLETLERLRALRPGVKVVMISGEHDEV